MFLSYEELNTVELTRGGSSMIVES